MASSDSTAPARLFAPGEPDGADAPSAAEASSLAAESSPVRIHLSGRAVAAVREMLEEEGLAEEGGLRVSAHFGAGCATSIRYGLILEPDPDPDDLVLAGQGIRIFIDPRSAWTLDGLRMDYVDSPGMGSGFAFQHPRGRKGRAC